MVPPKMSPDEATEACEGSKEGFWGIPSSSRLFPWLTCVFHMYSCCFKHFKLMIDLSLRYE